MGFRGSNASGRRIVLLPGVSWAHGASKMAILGASFLLCVLQCFRVWEGTLPPGACRMSHASTRRIVSCRGLCVSSLCSQIPLAPAPTFGAKRQMVPISRVYPPPCCGRTPSPGIFNEKPTPSLPGASDCLFPSPDLKKYKKYPNHPPR